MTWLREAISGGEVQIGTIDYRGAERPVKMLSNDISRWLALRNDDRILNELGPEWDALQDRMLLYAATKIEPNETIRESMNISLYPDIQTALEYYGYGESEAQEASAPVDQEKLREAVYSFFDSNNIASM